MPDAAAQSALAAELLQATGIRPEILPGEPNLLRSTLLNRQGGLLLLDLSLFPALLPILKPGRFQLIGITTLRHDPRAEKLAQWGAPTLHISQVPGHLAKTFGESVGRGSTPQTEKQPPVPGAVPGPPGPGAVVPNAVLPGAAVPAEAGGPQVVVVHSPKGGAGTSTIAVHLAAQWARLGLRVLLVDFSAYGAAAILCKTRQQGAGLESIAASLEMMPNCLTEGFDPSPYLVPLSTGPGCLDLLPGARPHLMDHFSPNHVSLLLYHCAQLPYDMIVVDTSAEPTLRTLAALETAHQLVLVATQDYTACWNLIHLLELLQTLRLESNRLLVLNRYTGVGMDPTEMQERLQLPLVAVLPEDPHLQELGTQGRPWDLQPGEPFWEAAAHLAAVLQPGMVVSPVG